MNRFLPCLGAAFGLALCGPAPAGAQAPLPLYTDRLVNGFEDWSWATRDLANTNPVHSGTQSISVTASTWQALSFYHAAFDATVYSNLTFWAHGGGSGGQRLQAYAQFDTNTGPTYLLPGLPANTWQRFVVPFDALGLARVTNLWRLNLQLHASGTSGTFYVDDVQLEARPAPALVRLSVLATQAVRSVDARWFGVNTAVWDNDFGDNTTERTRTIGLLREMGLTTLRFPGGSLSDEYHWASNKSGTNTWEWNTSFVDFWRVATNLLAEVFITVNYGSGTPQEAAGWVRHANVTNRLGFKYWEIGNENYGPWETDTNARPHDAYTYAVRAREYIQQMKAADPTIRVGVVAVPGEDNYANGYTDHPAYNPRTGQTHYGWTPVMLTTLKNHGVTPDFLVHHHYPQWTPSHPTRSPNSDALLLQSTGNWAADAADLRQQITDYFGAGGEQIELVVTENNSDAGAQGRQSTSLVNALYYADSLGRLMQTEFNAFVWWDLRNGTDTTGSFDPTLYGWRTFGDLGMINGAETRLPPFYAAKLMSAFARAGDTVVAAVSDYPLLAVHAARRTNGALSVLVINKDSATNLTASLSLQGFVPAPVAAVRSFGIPNDEAASTNGPAAARDVSTNSFAGAAASFSYTFPPLSLTLFSLVPAPPALAVVSPAPTNAFVFQLEGQPNVPYVIQSSTNLLDWVWEATHTLTTTPLNITNPVGAATPQKYWRALWQP